MWIKYDLTADQAQGLANLAKQEQGTIEGARAELCLMANLLEGTPEYRKKYGTDIYSFARNSGWFSRAPYWMDNGNAGEGYRKLVREVLSDGKRVLPLYVNEHDCFSDITTATGVTDKKDRPQYTPGKTIIRNKYGSTYTFFCFPTWTSDPFGYTKKTDFLPTPEDVINRADTYLGMAEPSGDDYFIRTYNSFRGERFSLSEKWCAMYVSVVMRLIGVPDDICPTFADCDDGKRWFFNRKRYMRSRPHGGSYVPQTADVVFYGPSQADSNHVGIVVSCDGATLTAIEGNHNDAVGYRTIALNDAKILGYGKVHDFLTKGDWDRMDMRSFINNLYTDDLFREATDAELDAWEKDTREHGRTPGDLQTIFRDSPEGREAWVKALYGMILHREPAPDEIKAWTTAMEAGESREAVMRDIQNSPEAQTK